MVLLLSVSIAQAYATGAEITVAVTPGAINSSTDASVQYTLTSVNNNQILIQINDSANNTVRAIDEGLKSSGNYSIAWNGTYANGTAVPDGTYQITVSTLSQDTSRPAIYLSEWGSKGTAPGQFNYPWGIAVSPNGTIYIADRDNSRIQAFGSSGTFVAQWGGAGAANGKFNSPWGVAVNSTGYVYVTDRSNCRVQVFDPNGTFVAKWGSPGTGKGNFYYPEGIAVNSTGYVYVADTLNNRVQVFGPLGNYITGWTVSNPRGLAVNSTDSLYVVSGNSHRVLVYDTSYGYLGEWGSLGTGAGQFCYPWGIVTDAAGRVYVSDMGNYRVEVFDVRGNYLSQFGTFGADAGQFYYPTGLGATASGYLYAVDTSSNRVEVFSEGTTAVASSGQSLIIVDNAPPVITGYTDISANEYGWFNTSVAVNFTAADNTSGLRGLTGNTTLTAEAENQSATGIAVDNAGNVAYLVISNISIDRTPPTVTATRSPGPNAAGWNNGPVIVTFTGIDDLSGIVSCSDQVTLTSEGEGQSISGTMMDRAGNMANATAGEINIDLTPPLIAINSPAGFYLLNQPVTADWVVVDSLSGVAAASGTTPKGVAVDTSTASAHTYRVTATDLAGNTNESSKTYYVGYLFEGLGAPLGKNSDASFNQGSAIPVKFRLADVDGKAATGAVASLNLSRMANGGIWGQEQAATSKNKANAGNEFRSDQAAGQYVYNLDTKPLAPGIWRLILRLDDGTVQYTTIQLT
jgi:DNA-binding beta-propeller fold protein YncE